MICYLIMSRKTSHIIFAKKLHVYIIVNPYFIDLFALGYYFQ